MNIPKVLLIVSIAALLCNQVDCSIGKLAKKGASKIKDVSKKGANSVVNVGKKGSNEIADFSKKTADKAAEVSKKGAKEFAGVAKEGANDVIGTAKKTSDEITLKKNGCTCEGIQCSCCLYIKDNALRLDDTICTQVSYKAEDQGVGVEVVWSNRSVLALQVSEETLGPVCASIPIPVVENLLKVCIDFYNIEIEEDRFSACTEVSLNALFVIKLSTDLGCFQFGPSDLPKKVHIK